MVGVDSAFYQHAGQGWAQLGDLALAFGLASACGAGLPLLAIAGTGGECA